MAEHGVLIGNHPLMRKVRRRIRAAAPTNLNIVIYGEAGTEKETAAWEMHKKSMRHPDRFISVNCYQLLEANKRYIASLFTSARGGTLFLNSIELLPLIIQRELYRLLTNSKEPPLYSRKHKESGVRIIAGAESDASLRRQEHDANFISRIQQFSIYIPPLRDRKSDFPLLFDYYFTVEMEKRGYEDKPAVTEYVLQALARHDWNGNIIELRNTIEILVDLSSKEALDADVIPFIVPEDPMAFLENYFYQEALEKADAYLIRRALEKADWNQTRAAKELQMTEGNIRRKMKKYRIVKPR